MRSPIRHLVRPAALVALAVAAGAALPAAPSAAPASGTGVAAATKSTKSARAAKAVPASARHTLPFVSDDYERALAQAKARQVPIFVESWAPW